MVLFFSSCLKLSRIFGLVPVVERPAVLMRAVFEGAKWSGEASGAKCCKRYSYVPPRKLGKCIGHVIFVTFSGYGQFVGELDLCKSVSLTK